MPSILDGFHPERLPPRELVERPVNELLDLHGKCAAVTGGHGPNFGQAIVNRLAGIGASVALVHRPHSAETARKVAAEVADRWGVTAVAVEGDMSDWDSAHRCAHRVVDELGALDIWVNSAGAGRDPQNSIPPPPDAPREWRDFANASQSLIDDSLTALLKTMLYGTHAALDVMVPQQRGRIINVASVAGLGAIRGQVTYATMKAAVIAFTEFVARETGPQGVTIACVAPGTMLSEQYLAWYATQEDEADSKNMQEVFDKLSIGRAAWVEEPANMVAFLASDAGAFVHGATIKVAGGR
jgi:3-oxoacyl-[acyl-carrier protein] reductase